MSEAKDTIAVKDRGGAAAFAGPSPILLIEPFSGEKKSEASPQRHRSPDSAELKDEKKNRTPTSIQGKIFQYKIIRPYKLNLRS